MSKQRLYDFMLKVYNGMQIINLKEYKRQNARFIQKLGTERFLFKPYLNFVTSNYP